MEALLEYIPPEFIGGVEYTMSPTNYFRYTTRFPICRTIVVLPARNFS